MATAKRATLLFKIKPTGIKRYGLPLCDVEAAFGPFFIDQEDIRKLMTAAQEATPVGETVLLFDPSNEDLWTLKGKKKPAGTG